SGNLAPADKKLYALRDVTATVDSIPLIAVSIMSKKLASGNDCILLDVKTGSGAFMKTLEDAIALAKEMVAIGEHAGKKTAALITNMDRDLTMVCENLACNMLFLAGKGDMDACMTMVHKVIHDGSALKKFIAMVEEQGGDSHVIMDTDKFPKAPYSYSVLAKQSGFIT
ncbi:MAG: thymidine phosphorylase, partial [Lachnospiraceae bacterium]